MFTYVGPVLVGTSVIIRSTYAGPLDVFVVFS